MGDNESFHWVAGGSVWCQDMWQLNVTRLRLVDLVDPPSSSISSAHCTASYARKSTARSFSRYATTCFLSSCDSRASSTTSKRELQVMLCYEDHAG
jgi:hypothetical protein